MFQASKRVKRLLVSRNLSTIGGRVEIGVAEGGRVLSGIQPTGNIHIGNYLGAVKQWVDLQLLHESLFCVVDLHALTVPQDPVALRSDTLKTAAVYLAAGVDPDKSAVFVQSHVSAHSELAWLMNCITPISWLERMVQFKEKSTAQSDSVCMGLMDYPVLMAADILLYRTDLVPVGEDQRQHLELSRDIARRFNDKYCPGDAKKILKDPRAFIPKESSRVMSLLDGTSKMSKSTISDLSRINLLDPPDVIALKIKKCKTDSIKGIEWDNPDRPEATNLVNIYQAVTNRTREEILNDISAWNWGKFKGQLTEAVISHLSPIQFRYGKLMTDQTHLDSVLKKGSIKANKIANGTLRDVKIAMGLVVP